MVELAPSGAADLVVTLQPNAREMRYHGVVVDAAGAPAPGAQVSAGETIVDTDDEGRFVLDSHGSNGVTMKDERGVWRQQGIQAAKQIALKRGFAPAIVRLAEVNAEHEIVLRLGGSL